MLIAIQKDGFEQAFTETKKYVACKDVLFSLMEKPNKKLKKEDLNTLILV